MSEDEWAAYHSLAHAKDYIGDCIRVARLMWRYGDGELDANDEARAIIDAAQLRLLNSPHPNS